MKKPTGGTVWTDKDGLSAPKVTRTSRDCGEMIIQEMDELDSSNMENAAKRTNHVTPISLQSVQMPTGHICWMGELLKYSLIENTEMITHYSHDFHETAFSRRKNKLKFAESIDSVWRGSNVGQLENKSVRITRAK